MGKLKFIGLAAVLACAPVFGGVLIDEKFDDTNLSSRGWYGGTGVRITTSQHVEGSNASAEFRFRKGATTADQARDGLRHKFPATDSLYLRFWIKHSSNWVGSNKSYHPHQFYFLTNKDGDWSGLASTYTTLYVEENAGQLMFFFQDAKNIDTSRINQNLTNVTERRGVAGCNGNSDGYPSGCYNSGGWRNEKRWKSGSVNFSNQAGDNYKGDWHLVEAYAKMNSIVGGKGVNNGILRMWMDGKTLIDRNDVLLRTGANADMAYNQIILGPYIGDGSPVDQTFWIDDVFVATERVPLDGGNPNPPVLLKVE